MKQVSAYSLPGFSSGETTSWPSIGLAALVHVLLLGFLWIGVQWQNKPATAIEAEVWDMSTHEAAPKPVEAVPEPEPLPPPKAQIEEEPKEDPEIALELERRKKLADKKREDERKKREQESARQAELKKEQDAKNKLAEQKKQQAKEQAARDKLFAENMRRLTGQAAVAAVAGSGGTGTAAKSSGNNRGDPGYGAKIAAKVRSNTVFSLIDQTTANPTVEYHIELLPDGSLRGPVRKLKSSGVAGFDEAVAKGIEKSAPFPRDKSGQVPASIDLVYRMKEE